MDVIDVMLIDSRQNISSKALWATSEVQLRTGWTTPPQPGDPCYPYIFVYGHEVPCRSLEWKKNIQQHVFLLMLFWWLCPLGSMLGPCWVIWWAIAFHGNFPKEKTTFTKSRLFAKVLFWSCLTQVEGYVRPMLGQLGSMLGPCWLDLVFIFVFFFVGF